MEINHDGVEVNLSNKINTSVIDANVVSFHLEQSIHSTASLETRNFSEHATYDQGKRIPYRTKSPPPPTRKLSQTEEDQSIKSSSKSFEKDEIPLKSSSWSYPSKNKSSLDSDSFPLSEIDCKFPEYALSPTRFENGITEDEFELTKRLFKLRLQQLNKNQQKDSNESNLHSGYSCKIEKPKPMTKSVSETFILTSPSHHTASNLSKAEEDLLVQTLRAENDDLTKAEEDLLMPTLRSTVESNDKSDESPTNNFVGAFVDYMGGKVSGVSSVLDSLRVSESNSRKKHNLSKQNDHNGADDMIASQDLKAKSHEKDNSNISKQKSKRSGTKSSTKQNDATKQSNTNERSSRSRSRSRLKSDGRTRVRRSRKIKSEFKAKANAQRLHINCQKVNLTPLSDIEVGQTNKQDQNVDDNNGNNLNHLHEFCRIGDISDQDMYNVNDTNSDCNVSGEDISSQSIVTHEILRANWTWYVYILLDSTAAKFIF